MIDKRFWSSGILVLTVIVAGASSLPALLLRPAPPDPLPAAPIAKMAEPSAVRFEAPPFAKAELVLATPPEVAVLESAPKRVAPAPALGAIVTPEPAPPTPAREATFISFPPVQPIEVAAIAPAQPNATPATEPRTSTTPSPVRQKTAGAKRKTRQAAKRKRNVVRPAFYPIREFFAWRR